MSSIGELFGFPGETNDAPFDAANLDSEINRIMATRPIPGAPDGYVSPHPGGPPAPQGDGVGAAGGTPGPAGSVAPETPAAPPPFGWPAGPASEYPPAPVATPPAVPPPPAAPQAPPAAPAAPPPPVPAAPAADPFAGTPFAGMTPLEAQELALLRQGLRDPERQAGIRRAYIGAPEPIGGMPSAPPPAAPPFAIGTPPPPAAPPVEQPLPEGLVEGTPEAQIWRTQQEQARQLEEIRAGVVEQTRQTEEQLTVQAAGQAVQAFQARYGDRLSPEEINWICQTAGYQKLPEAFRSSNPALSREAAFTQALEFQLRSTDSLLTKIVSGPPAAAPPGAPPATPPAPAAPVVYPGQTPQADARHRYLTALSSAASPSGEAPSRTPLAHRPDGKLDERSRMQLVQEMTSGGTMGELMGPN